MASDQLQIPILVWVKMIRAVRTRGMGQRESGAFLLGRRKNGIAKVSSHICYDDLDPHALDSGIVVFRSVGFKALWARCRKSQLEVLADVHTHGDAHPRQSTTDHSNPMITEAGHLAFILPRFAQTWGWRFRDVAIYEYAGNYRWRDWSGSDRKERVRFCLW